MELTEQVRHRWSMLPRSRQILVIAALAGGLVGYLFTGWFLIIPVIAVPVIGIPVLLSTPPNREIQMLEALDRWVRALLACLPTGKSIPDAIRSIRKQAPKIIAPQLQLLAIRLDERWPLPEAMLAFADECDSPEVDEVAAALIVAGRRGGVGVSASLEALADSVQDRLAAAREIELERDKPRIVVRQVTVIILVVVALSLFTSPEYFSSYQSGLGLIILVCLIAAYLGSLLRLRTAGVPAKRDRVLRPRVPVEEARV
jgi:Flp pilus assembly protein TadB